MNLKEVFSKHYRVVDDGTDDPVREERVWCQEIRGRYGVIYPYGQDGSLGVTVFSRKMACKLREDFGLETIQQWDREATLKFPPSLIHQVAGMIKAKKRRQLSQEQRENLLWRLKGTGKRSGGIIPDSGKAVLVPEERTF